MQTPQTAMPAIMGNLLGVSNRHNKPKGPFQAPKPTRDENILEATEYWMRRQRPNPKKFSRFARIARGERGQPHNMGRKKERRIVSPYPMYTPPLEVRRLIRQVQAQAMGVQLA